MRFKAVPVLHYDDSSFFSGQGLRYLFSGEEARKFRAAYRMRVHAQTSKENQIPLL
jgi:hypothetical protein